MNANLLKQVGEALYGPRWQSDLAHDLDVSDRTMRNWISGKSPIPKTLHVDLLRLCMERSQVLEDLAEILKKVP